MLPSVFNCQIAAMTNSDLEHELKTKTNFVTGTLNLRTSKEGIGLMLTREKGLSFGTSLWMSFMDDPIVCNRSTQTEWVDYCRVRTDPGKSWIIKQMVAELLTQCTRFWALHELS